MTDPRIEAAAELIEAKAAADYAGPWSHMSEATKDVWRGIARAVLAAADAARPAGPPYEFDRYVGGVLMAEGVTITRQADLPSAAREAARLARPGENGEIPVLVLVGAARPAAPDVEALCERLDARTHSRWESDVQAVMDYEDADATEAASTICRLSTGERDDARAQWSAYKKDAEYLTVQRCMAAENRADLAEAKWDRLQIENNAAEARLKEAVAALEAIIKEVGTSTLTNKIAVATLASIGAKS